MRTILITVIAAGLCGCATEGQRQRRMRAQVALLESEGVQTAEAWRRAAAEEDARFSLLDLVPGTGTGAAAPAGPVVVVREPAAFAVPVYRSDLQEIDRSIRGLSDEVRRSGAGGGYGSHYSGQIFQGR